MCMPQNIIRQFKDVHIHICRNITIPLDSLFFFNCKCSNTKPIMHDHSNTIKLNKTSFKRTKDNKDSLTYPFVKQEAKNMWSKWLAPKLDNQVKDGLPTFRHTYKVISKHIIETQWTINDVICRRNDVFFVVENYICHCEYRKSTFGNLFWEKKKEREKTVFPIPPMKKKKG